MPNFYRPFGGLGPESIELTFWDAFYSLPCGGVCPIGQSRVSCTLWSLGRSVPNGVALRAFQTP